MNQYVVSPILHGVQFSEIQDDYASDFIQGVKSFLPEDQRGFWVPVPYNWTHLTHGRQMFVYSLVESGLMNQKLRKLKHVVGSDVVWSARAKPGTKCFYNDFVLELTEKINYHLNIYKGAKLITMGHSQGTQLLLCYFFDYPSIVDGFMSMGSPISMGSGMFDNFGRVPPNLGFWWNFYNTRDFISSRIQDVHPSSEIKKFAKDFRVPLGLNPLGWTTIGSHCAYWKSKFVHKTIAEKLSKIISNNPLT